MEMPKAVKTEETMGVLNTSGAEKVEAILNNNTQQ